MDHDTGTANAEVDAMRPISARISAAAMRHNLALARRHAGAARVWAVVKANAYGHGLHRAAAALEGADGYALLELEAAVALRERGTAKPVLLLEGFFGVEELALFSKHRLSAVVHSVEQIAMLEKTSLDAPIEVYLKLNTGMNRLGIAAEQFPRVLERLRTCGRVAGIVLMSHFADADGGGGVSEQLRRFRELTAGTPLPACLANSAALLRYPEARADWVRAGIMLYGCSPFAQQSAASFDLRPAMTLASRIISVQVLSAGDRVGYGGTFAAAAAMRIGVVACGYADGYPRHAPTGTPVLVAGKRARTVGRVSMDLLAVDITDLPEARAGTEVTLWGEGLSADEVAASAGTVSYQLLCALAPRVPVLEAD